MTIATRTRQSPPPDGSHRVKVGESVASIAYDYGHFWATLWDHPQNQKLRELRSNPNILHEGDELFVPPLETETVSCQLDRRHTFRRKGVPSVLRVRVFEPPPKHIHSLKWLLGQDPAGSSSGQHELRPWANIDYVVTVGWTKTEGVADSDGVVSVPIVPNATSAVLVLAPGTEHERTLSLDLGHIHPIDTPAGVRERLNNLGFTCEVTSEPDSAAALTSAITRFQLAHELEVTGELDDATKNKLVEAYGS
jgi:hypothetical protein